MSTMQTVAAPALFEREHELNALGAALERACEGSGRTLLVEGRPGVGKSRLLASARARARELGMTVLEARGAVLERDFAFGVARQLFEHLVAELAPLEREALFTGAAAFAATLLGAGTADSGADHGDQAFGALHALYWLTVNLADRGPILISVDDGHWADSSSLRFLAYLAPRLEGLPLALMATGLPADPEGDEVWRQLTEDPMAEVLHPGPLSEEAAARLVRDRLGRDADGTFCAACHRATGGNPLFLRELLGALRDAGVEPTADAAAQVSEVGPPAVRRFVLHRLGRLGPVASALARAVAVLGGDADLPIAARAADLGREEAQAVADTLVRAEVLAADRRLRFVHPIVQSAVYGELLPGERSRQHLAAARLLAETGVPPEQIAAHILESTPTGEDQWIDVLRRAASDAIARAAPAAATAYLSRAVEENPAGPVRAELLCELGRWEVGLQEYDRAHEHLLAALQGPAPIQVRARAAAWLGRSETAASRPRFAGATLEAILSTLREADGEPALELDATALLLSRVALPLRGLVPERLNEFEQRAAGDPRYEPMARVHASAERMLAGDPVCPVADEVEALLAATPPGDPWVLGIAIESLIFADRYLVAGRWLDLAVDAARALGLATQLAGAHSQRSLLGFARGAVGAAQLDAGTALELAGPRHFALPRIVGMLMQTAVERGELDVAEALAERHADLFEGERLFHDELLTGRARLRIARGRLEEGLADLLYAGELLVAYRTNRPADWRTEAVCALAAADAGDRAEELARQGLEHARRFGATRGLIRALRSAGVAIGGDEGLELLEEAVTVARHSPARLEAAYAHADLARELVARRRRREGREILRLGLEEAVKCGATALCERIRGDLSAGGGRPARLELTGFDALTPAERRVCELASHDLSNREVAQTLFVTEKTVELHLTSAYRKLGIRSRFQLSSLIPAAVTAG